MSRFRKKPIVVEAEQWFPERQVAGVVESAGEFGYIMTLEGGHYVSPGDWVITGIAGEKYPCKPHIFEATYEPVGEDCDE